MLRTACYDAENRMVSVTDVNGTSSTYTYDGSGLRISKTSGGNTTTYVYDAFGDLAAEYSSQATTSACDTNTCYPILDHLGSTRMLTDANGSSTVTRYDYLPFGQELLASTNGRSTGMGYLGSPDGSNPKFTGKNRDNESGFDWFEVRHMSGAQGRFQSADPGNAGAHPEDPQTWNGYSYVGNNPLSYTDPSGQGFWSNFLTFLVGFFGGNIYPPVGSGFPNIGDVNGGPWNEQIPYSLHSSGLDKFGIDNFEAITDGSFYTRNIFANFIVPWLLFGDKTCSARPVNGNFRISGEFGESRPEGRHPGRDIATPLGTPVYAPEAGVVGFAGARNTAGNMVGIQNYFENNFFLHLSKTSVQPGQRVSAGTLVGYSGNTPTPGTSTHLHFETREPGPLFATSGPRQGFNAGRAVEPCR